MFYLYKESAYLPLELRLINNANVYTSQVYAVALDTVNYVPGLYQIMDTLVGLTYGDHLHLTLTDICGISIYGYYQTIAPFDFHYTYYTPGTGCSNMMAAQAWIKAYPYYSYDFTTMHSPVTMTLKDVLTNAIVDTDTCFSFCSYVHIDAQTGGRTYQITITDACGEVFQQNIIWPSPAAPSVQASPGEGCLDSTAVAYFNCYNFMSGTTITIHSGPSTVGSSKPGYEHRATITYPQVYTNMRAGGITLRDLAAGTYSYTVSDSCGQSVSGTFTVAPANLANFNYDYSIKRGCLGVNTLYIDANMQAAAVWVKDSTGAYIYQRVNYQSSRDSINSVVPGTYALEIYYGNSPYGGGVFDTTVVAANRTCWVVYDTIVVPPYDNSTFKSNTTILCNGITYVELNVDSTKGVPPYQYEISSGPQTFPLQNSNTFQITALGTYIIRIRDACGNSNIQQITIASDTFPPIIKKGIMCPNGRVVLAGISSAYFDYEWRRPNGGTSFGDSLIIDPLTVADTGVYNVTKYVHINGCIDTFRTSYHVTFTDSFPQNIIICTGDTLFVGTEPYTVAGRYVDTLTSMIGCDSIIITNLTVLNQTTTINDTTICMGDQIVVDGNAYTLPGTYRDSIAIGGCYQIIVTNLTVNGIADTVASTICLGDTLFVGNHAYTGTGIYRDTLISSLGCDSIIVSDLTVLNPTWAAMFAICPGDSVTVAGSTYYTQGLHFDTIPSAAGCDSIILTVINFLPQGRDTINAQICTGGSYLFGGNTLTIAGTYFDTIPTANCDSILMLNLSVSNYLRDTIAAAICPGDSFVFHGNTLISAGTYNDTITAASCDSIVTLVLTQLDYIRDTVAAGICPGASFVYHGNTYTTAGSYVDTIQASGCDSIITLQLTALPYLTHTINRSICPGSSYNFYGNTLTTAGTYTDTVSGPACDSIITLNLAIVPYLRDTVATAICNGSSYNFYGNSLTVAGTYVDTITGPSCDSIITLNLTVVAFLRDTLTASICAGDGYSFYGNTITISGTYVDTVSGSACDSIITLYLAVVPITRDTIDETICEGESITFGGQVYGQAGVYQDTLTSAAGCDSIVVLNLEVDAAPDVTILANATEVYAGDTVLLNTTATTVLNYVWTATATLNNPQSQHPTAVVTEPVWITMTAWDANNCPTHDSIFIDILPGTSDCGETYLHIPNVFSPNNDGQNDEFVIFHQGLNVIELKIFNRWGELVYRTKDINEFWDGTYKGVAMAPDVYVYYVTYLPCDGHFELYKEGSITILK